MTCSVLWPNNYMFSFLCVFQCFVSQIVHPKEKAKPLAKRLFNLFLILGLFRTNYYAPLKPQNGKSKINWLSKSIVVNCALYKKSTKMKRKHFPQYSSFFCKICNLLHFEIILIELVAGLLTRFSFYFVLNFSIANIQHR